VKGKPWTVEEEKQLREMVAAGKRVKDIAAVLGKSQGSVNLKLKRSGLKVVVRQISLTTTSNDELPSVEEALRKLNSALAALGTEGLDPAETLRLRTIIQGLKIYKELLADYVDYRGLERELEDWREKYAVLAKNKKSQSVQA
jgi:hypothetical protein